MTLSVRVVFVLSFCFCTSAENRWSGCTNERLPSRVSGDIVELLTFGVQTHVLPVPLACEDSFVVMIVAAGMLVGIVLVRVVGVGGCCGGWRYGCSWVMVVFVVGVVVLLVTEGVVVAVVVLVLVEVVMLLMVCLLFWYRCWCRCWCCWYLMIPHVRARGSRFAVRLLLRLCCMCIVCALYVHLVYAWYVRCMCV